MSSPLLPYVVRYYAELKQHYPTEGRRKWRLRVAQRFWSAVRSGGPDSVRQPDTLPDATCLAEFDTDTDPLDGVTIDVPQLGLIVRTDFSDEHSWLAFCTRLQDSEKDLILGKDNDIENQPPEPDDEDEPEGSGSDDEDEDTPPTIFSIINPSSSEERELLANISNLAVLRLFNDADVRPSPTPPDGASRVNPPNRLVDYHGWQEFYRGKNVWIYDTKSNVDQCVRVVSQSGDMYSTATGDSWRARVSHISELQVNLASGAIKIDFGGLDRWDYNERQRNMLEAKNE